MPNPKRLWVRPVYGHQMSIGISGSPQSIDDSVIAAYAAGQSVDEIAYRYQVSSDVVSEIVRKNNVGAVVEFEHEPATAPARFCTGCGAGLVSGAGFCPRCGNPVAATMRTGAARSAAMWVVLAAGIAAVIGSFLAWTTVTAPIIGTISKSGVELSDGWVSIGLGVLLAAFAAVRLWPIKFHGAVTVVAGVVAASLVGLGVVEFLDLMSKADEAKSQMAGQDDPLGIGAALSAAVQIDAGAGLWLVTAAGLVGSAALLMTIVSDGGSGKAVAANSAALVLVLAAQRFVLCDSKDQEP